MITEFISDITSSSVSWIILLVALVCYQRLATHWLSPEKDCEDSVSPVLISILPLLGLLGTIIGLLDSFTAMQYGLSGMELFSSGIGDALLTTQLGLLCAVPAWLVYSALQSRQRREA
ncbi:MotA/TolQ/ExbB proton channel family protein [Thalassolituus sp.]|jgi:biopolymer transport protein ExbB|uniref:MotA/TolQ/ExbB proton channel family protein n=1 Tax=Thalassolituus sp. TaxID=2030822 RepID=UPI0026311E95|nr:MotA/TolQ/ExbB proton channel family protein [uncultured Thalassolituus sp.]TNC92880.1 MAG: hypothetical protein CSH36_02210 [Thalassolituus sp.]